MARVVVIGAGVSGLAAAARLARFRHDVLVLERAGVPGGQAGRYERDGFAFDTGPTLLHLPATYRDLFIKTGKTAPLESVLGLEPVDPAIRWHFPDGTRVELPNASRAGTMEAISAALGPAAAQQWDAFLAAGQELWATFRKGFLGPAVPPPKRSWRPRPAASLAGVLAGAGVTDERLRAVAFSYARRLGADPKQAADTVAVWPAMEHTFGTWRPTGGIRRLVDAIADRAELRGAELRYGTEVAAIEIESGAVTGVRLTDGTAVAADLVLAAVDDRVLERLTAGALPADAQRSGPWTSVLLALRGEATSPPSLLLAGPERPLLHLGPATAPAGHTAWTVTAPGGITPADVLSGLAVHGLDVTDRLLWAQPHSTDASLTGPVWHGNRGRHRPPNETAVRGLFRIGASTHPGPGIDLAPLSAALVADAIGRSR